MQDEEKGIIYIVLSQIHQTNDKIDLYLKGEIIYSKSKSGRIIIKPFKDEDYFVMKGKQNNRNYIAEIKNGINISTNDDQPEINKIYVSHRYIAFYTEDNIHIIYRGIEENIINPIEKQFIFELIGVQDIQFDQSDENIIYAITST